MRLIIQPYLFHFGSRPTQFKLFLDITSAGEENICPNINAALRRAKELVVEPKEK